MKFSITTARRINKYSSKLKNSIRSLKTKVLIFALRIIAFAASFIPFGKRSVAVEEVKTKTDDCIVVNCMGCIDVGSNTSLFGRDLDNIRSVLSQADISFASSRFKDDCTVDCSGLKKSLKENRIVDVLEFDKSINSVLYKTSAGNFATVSYNQIVPTKKKRHIKIELAKEYYNLKRMGAEYIVLYINNAQIHKLSNANNRLCKLMLNIGYDYIVNVRPKIFHSGVTHRQHSGAVSRAIYSIGTLLSNRDFLPQERASIRLKLRNVNGKLQAFEESYYPLVYNDAVGLRALDASASDLSNEDIAAITVIEKGMSRLRSVDSIITVKDIVDAIGAELPDKYKYIADFSVGRISARFNVHKAGDVYVRWQPHTESNDADTYDERVRYAKRATKAAEKIDMFIVTYKDFGIKTPHVVVEDALEAHIAIGTLLRKQHDFKCVAVTGSIGKTSTKDMLAEVFNQQYNTVKSSKNENIHSKISLALQEIPRDCEVYIQELGGGRPGGASRHSRMVLPDYTVVTNIGDAHLGNFDGNKELLMKNKLEIIDGMPENGILYLNGDDPLLVNARPACKTVFFAVHNKNADYYAENVVADDNKTYFDVVHNGERCSACVNVPGEHNVLNAICAFAIGKQFGISDENIVSGIANFKTHGIRQNIVTACGVTMFLDCYNASSGSFESSIKTLAQIKKDENAKRVALLGDITGLGEMAQAAHTEIAVPLIENPADVFVFYGKDIRYTYDAVKAHGFECYYVSSEKELLDLLPGIVKPGDVVMAKGSSKMKLEYVLDRVFGTRFFDNVLIEENSYVRAKTGNIEYNLFNTHATAVSAARGITHVRVRSKVGAVTVNNIGSTFRSASLRHVTLPDTIYHIGESAFRDCRKLKAVVGANNLKYIGSNAFRKCFSLESFKLPETLLHIDKEAFGGCINLQELYIPESVVQIGPGAFAGCPNLKITCKAGSYAESYLAEAGIEYTCV